MLRQQLRKTEERPRFDRRATTFTKEDLGSLLPFLETVSADFPVQWKRRKRLITREGISSYRLPAN
jgi:hypothetical protein